MLRSWDWDSILAIASGWKNTSLVPLKTPTVFVVNLPPIPLIVAEQSVSRRLVNSCAFLKIPQLAPLSSMT